MTQIQIRDLQLIELDMLKAVLEIISSHGLRYYALGGTLLGAVRHHGFIPWDDDIDIGIPREDYEKFLEYASSELPHPLKIQYFRNQGRDPRPVYACQVINSDIQIVQHIANKPIYTNVWIDIFPLDGMPDNTIRRKLHAIHLLERRMWIQFSMFDRNVHRFRKSRPWYEKLLIRFYQAFHPGRNRDPYLMMEKMDQALKKYTYDGHAYLINFMGAWKLKEMFPKSFYKEGIGLQFEDILLNCPVEYDRVLTQMYGDYMIPVTNQDEQAKHHSISIME